MLERYFLHIVWKLVKNIWRFWGYLICKNAYVFPSVLKTSRSAWLYLDKDTKPQAQFSSIKRSESTIGSLWTKERDIIVTRELKKKVISHLFAAGVKEPSQPDNVAVIQFSHDLKFSILRGRKKRDGTCIHYLGIVICFASSTCMLHLLVWFLPTKNLYLEPFVLKHFLYRNQFRRVAHSCLIDNPERTIPNNFSVCITDFLCPIWERPCGCHHRCNLASIFIT